MLSGDGNENSQKNSRSDQQKNNLARAAHFRLFFAAVLHNNNVKLPKTSQVHFLRRKSCIWSCSLFFTAAHFHLGGRYFSLHTAAIKFSCYSTKEIGLLCFFISGCSFFSVIHANVDIKIKSKERIGFVVVVFCISKSLGGYVVYRRNARVHEMQNYTPAYMKGWTYVWTIFSDPKFLGCIVTNFSYRWCYVTRSSRARDLRYYNVAN